MRKTNYVTPRPYVAPLHAYRPKRDPQPEARIEIPLQDTALVVGTLVLVCLILGALFGAARMDQRHQRQLQDCEAQYSKPCAIVAIPQAGSNG